MRSVFFFALIIGFVLPAHAEFLFLKDGNIIEGSIINDTTSEMIFRSKDNKTLRVKREQVLRILYTELKMGKIYVQDKVFKDQRSHVADVKTTSYTIKSSEQFDSIYIRAVDDMNAESEDTKARTKNKIENIVDIQPSIIMPLGTFSKMAGTGYGVSANYSMLFLINERILLTGESGFYYFKGKDYNSNDRFDSIFMIPLMAGVSWHFEPRWNIAFTPGIRAGVFLINASFHANDRDAGTTNQAKSAKSFADAAVKIGSDARYRFGDTFSLCAGLWGGALIEKGGILPFAQGTLGAGCKF
jgi:hypothetical protein